MAIDNVCDSDTSIKHTKMFLEAPTNKGSLVIVMARYLSILEFLGMDGDACLDMPKLGEVDATNLFLHYAHGGQHFVEEEDKHAIKLCIARCHFHNDDGKDMIIIIGIGGFG